MAVAEQHPESTTMSRPGVLTAFKGVAIVSAVLIFVQAMLAGRGWFVNYDLIAIHGHVGNALFVVVIGQGALALAVAASGNIRRAVLSLNLALVALVVAQIGLGYGARTSANAAAWHIPLGVLIFGLASVNLALVLPAGRPAR